MKKSTFLYILVLFLICSCSTISIKNTNELDPLITECDEQLTGKIGKTIPGAVVVFIENNEIYFQKAYGYKDKKNHDEMSVDTIFQVGSISKPVFAIAVMKLMQDGLINLDSPIEHYLNRWHLPTSKNDKNRVTARSLLSHSAGLSGVSIGYIGYNPKKQLPTLEQSLSSLFYSVKLKRNPGEKWKYTGGGYTVLQLAVEEITGQKLFDYAGINFFTKMNMAKSSYVFNSSMGNDLARPYNSFGKQMPNYLYAETAAAGLYTTALDLAQLLIEIMNCYNDKENNLVIDKESLELMFTPEININTNEFMGMGLFIYDVGNGIKTYGHGGSNRGWKARFEFCPDKNSGIIILANGDLARNKINTPIILAWREYISKK